MISLTLFKCQSQLRFSLFSNLDLVQNLTFLPKRNYAINNRLQTICKNQQRKNFEVCINLRRHVYGATWVRGRLTRMSPLSSAFVIGFGTMSGLVIVESIFDRYRRSGTGLFDFFNGDSSQQLNIDDASNKLQTKYASLLSEVPNFKPSRIVPGAVNLPNMKITLLQYQTCPFCCKVRAFLDYYGLPYEVVEVNSVFRTQLKFSKSYKKVPMLLISYTSSENNDQQIVLDADLSQNNVLQLNDSTLIISTLTSYLLSRRAKSRHHDESIATISKWYLNSQVFYHEDEEMNDSKKSLKFKAKKTSDELVNKYFLMIGDIDPVKYERMDGALAEERRWRRWVDDDFVHVLSPNIYRTFDEALKSFNYFSQAGDWEQHFSNWERTTVINVGAFAMYLVGKKLKKKYGLKDDVRQSLYDSCNYWLKSVGPNRRFMGGDLPNLADLAVYGALSSIEGCDAFNDLIKNTKMSRWYFDVQLMVKHNQGSSNIKSLLV